jgi:hypothetical protein
MKEYWALDRGKWSTSRPGRFASEREPGYQLTRRLSGPQSRFGPIWKRKKSFAADPVAAGSKVWVCGYPLAWDCEFESRRGHGCLFLVNVVCYQLEVSASV